ncbi:MAG: matrixin family metalloprotease [Bdellovibrionales bacterium]|nr:matrixin family metalloprotease [Bdellovibrionales bacterium]
MKSILAISVILIISQAQAFTLNNSAKLTFNKNDVTVSVAGGFCTNIGITDSELLAIVSSAVDKFWNTVPTSRLKLRKGSVVNVSSNFYNDQMCVGATNCDPNPDLEVDNDILITCNNNVTNFPSSGILGVTIPNNIGGSSILGSLIMINDRPSTRFAGKSYDEKVAIIAHEIGHAFGLGHSPVTDSLMYYATVSERRRLGQDDWDGMTYLYPKQQPISGCGTIDFNSGNNKPEWWSGLFIGFSIIALAEIVRKRKFRTSSYT